MFYVYQTVSYLGLHVGSFSFFVSRQQLCAHPEALSFNRQSEFNEVYFLSNSGGANDFIFPDKLSLQLATTFESEFLRETEAAHLSSRPDFVYALSRFTVAVPAINCRFIREFFRYILHS